jgi:hypothetical protein
MAVSKLLFFHLLLLLPFIGLSQENILKRKISFEAHNQKLESVLLGIANVGNFSFSYNPQIIPGDSTVNLNVSNSTVNEVLDVLFHESIVYKVSGNHLILLKNKPVKVKENVKYSVSGYVFDAKTGDRLISTTIYEVYTLASTITDEQGYYTLNLTKKYDEFGLSYSKREFVDTLIIVQPANANIDISLRPKWTQQELAIKEPDLQTSVKPLDNVSIVQKFVPKDQIVRSDNIDVIERRPAQISLIPKIGTNTKMSGSIENSFSLNVLAGYSAGVRGVEVGGLMNINKRHVSGFQIAGLSNIVGGRTRGVQFAGISNILQGGMKGWQLAGISNVTTKNVDGVQMSGISNFARGDVDVMQISGIINMGRNVNGVQAAGIVNTATGKVGGVQLAGIGNYAREVNAGQISSIMNIATKRVKGVQLAAIINYGKEIKGSQIALFNISDTVSGLPIGFLSFVRKGYQRVELSGNEVMLVNLSLKTGVHKLYNIFTGGIEPADSINTWSFGYGIGFENSLGRKFLQNIDLTVNYVSEKDKPFGTFNLLNKLTLNYAYRLGNWASVFLGPTINVHLSGWKDEDTGEFLTKIAPYSFNTTIIGDTQMQIWVGGQLGFRFL